MTKLLFLLSFIALSSLAEAAAPRSLTLAHSTFQSRSLGGLCYSLDSSDGLPCNAAFINNEPDKNYGLKIFGSNNVSYLEDAKGLIDGNVDAERIETLFSQTRDSKMELSTELSYRREGFGISLTPYQLKYYSFIRNRALPQLTILAMREQNLRLQYGEKMDADTNWGVEIRGVSRKFVAQSFSILDVAVEGGDKLFSSEDQKALYLEPAIVHTWHEYTWSPSVSAAVANLGFTNKKYDSLPNTPELHLGANINPTVSLGAWQLGVDLALHNEIEAFSDSLRLGTVYEFGITRLSASFGANDTTLGVQMRYGAGLAGIVYQSQLIENWLAEKEWLRTLSLQIGAEF